jgi:hypothetical protein
MVAGRVDGELVAVSQRQKNGIWSALSFIRLRVSEGKVVDIVDYSHCPWVLAAAGRVEII